VGKRTGYRGIREGEFGGTGGRTKGQVSLHPGVYKGCFTSVFCPFWPLSWPQSDRGQGMGGPSHVGYAGSPSLRLRWAGVGM